MQVREKVGKPRNTVFFQWFVAPEGRKVGSLKRRVRSHVVRWEMKSCTPLWREAHLPVKKSHLTFGALSEVEMSKKCTPLWCEADFQVKMRKTHQRRTTFGSCDVEKVHGIVARSAFPSQNVPKKQRRTTFGSCYVEKVHGVVARISKSKCAKHTNIGPLLEVVMSKKSTPLWLEAHIQVKSAKQKLKGTEHFWTLRCRFAWQAQGVLHRQTWGFCSSFNYNHHYTTLHYTTTTTTITTATITTLHYTTLITVH